MSMLFSIRELSVPVLLAVLVHSLIGALLLVTWPEYRDATDLFDEPYIRARVMTMTPSAPPPAKKQPLRKPSPVPQRLVPQTPEPVPVPPKPAEPAPDSAAIQRDKERQEVLEAVRREQFKDQLLEESLAMALAEESEALTVYEQALRADEAAQSYAAQISQLVEQAWSRPPSARNGMEAELVIDLVPTGEVVAVNIVRGSGDGAFDRSAVRAVQRVGQFDVPSESVVFERFFRRFRLLFRPEDLMR